jgi:peptide/nickel transport system substrate-binding protein
MQRSRRWGKAGSVIVGFALVVFGLTACGGSTDETDNSDDGVGGAGTLTMASSANPSNLNPALSATGLLGQSVLIGYEPLYWLQPDGSFEPALAVEWGFVDEDSTVFVFTLREDAFYSDGTPVNAQTAVDSINYWKNAGGPFTTSLQDVVSIEATGEYEVTITSASPNSDLPQSFTQYWMAGDLIAPAGVADPERLGTETLGAGPYMLDKDATIAGNTYSYIPNPYYYDPSLITWDRIELKVYSDSSSALSALQSGQAQIVYADARTAESVKDDESIHAISSLTNVSMLAPLDRDGEVLPALADPRVREALSLALDREAISAALTGDFGAPAMQMRAEGFAGYVPELNEQFPYDPKRARKLLAEAGYGDGLVLPEIHQGVSKIDLLAQTIAAQLADVGVTLELNGITDLNQFTPELTSKKYPLMSTSVGMPSPYAVTRIFLNADGTYNPFHTTDPQLDEYVNTAKSQGGDAWQDVFAFAVTEYWWIPIMYESNIYLASQDVVADPPGQALNINPVFVKPAK